MTKQEFLAMSLLSGLHFIAPDSNEWILDAMTNTWIFVDDCDGDSIPFAIIDCKPILHPLSDLTKEIEHKGEKFVPMKVIWSLVYPKFKSRTFDFRITTDSIFFHSLYTGYDCHLYTKNIEKNYFWKVQKLIEWHFDVAGLIEKGEAIDVNTLSENPYK